MMIVSVEEAKRNLDDYLRHVAAGETIVLTQANRPVAEVVPVAPEDRELRPYGLAAGAFVVPDDFDAPLPDDVLREFEGR